MKNQNLYLAVCLFSLMLFSCNKELVPWDKGAFETRQYRNLFAEAGYPQAEINKKLNQIFYNLFEGPDKIYFEVGDTLGYVSDIKNHDARSEGMSYGMMIAVQLDKKDIFDRLWRWSKKYMQHAEGPMEGYFAWSCKTDGTRNAQGPASDGELYFITALIFASNLWGNDTGINYLKEAQYILDCSMNKDGTNGVTNLINMDHKLITFVPTGWGASFTDPSYHIPAFYEVWARWADDGRAGLWNECAEKSRAYLHTAIHPETGLNPDYANYDGTPFKTPRGVIGEAFRFDSWRVPMNIALDYSWSCADKAWQQEYGYKFQNFLYGQGVTTFIDQYNVDGSMVSDTLQAGNYAKNLRHSLGLVATSAAVSLASGHPHNRDFIRHFWESENKPYEDGFFDAYFDGLLQLFSFMHLSGNYKIIFPTFQNTGNPLIKDKFTADPAPLVYNGKLYLYVGHDVYYEGQDTARGGKEFNITEWLCYSTEDMQTWTDHGVVLKPTDFSWGVGEAWASQVIERDGKFYYYTTVQAGEPYNSKAIGIAVADSPTGPFKDAIGKPLVTDDMTSNGPRGWWNDIDPTAFIDDNGEAWLCWGNGTCFLAKLKPDLLELDGDIQVVDVPRFVEGPWLHKRGDIYYLTYASMGQGRETISYATASSMEGPWTPQGELTGMAENSFTIHPGIIEFKDKWYLFYHNAVLTLDGRPGAIGRRSVCVEELNYNPDGTMQHVKQTGKGAKI